MRPNGFWTQVDYSCGYEAGQGTSTCQAEASADPSATTVTVLRCANPWIRSKLVIALGAPVNAW